MGTVVITRKYISLGFIPPDHAEEKEGREEGWAKERYFLLKILLKKTYGRYPGTRQALECFLSNRGGGGVEKGRKNGKENF